jgi:hypothetical protein
MITKIDWPKLRETFPLHQKIFLDYISRLRSCVENYKNGEINVDTALKTCKIILHEINDPEFPFFAVKNFRELFSIIFYQLPKISALRRAPTLQSKVKRKLNWRKILMYKDRERRKYKRIEKPFMARLRIKQYEGLKISSAEWDVVALRDLSAGGVLFNYNKNLGINSLLDLNIDVSTATPAIKCLGKVNRIEQSLPYYTLRIAAEFTGIEEKGKELINATIEEILE